MACTTSGSLCASVGWASFGHQRGNLSEADGVSTCARSEAHPQRLGPTAGIGKARKHFRSHVQSSQQLFTCNEIVHANHHGRGALHLSACSDGNAKSSRMSSKFWGWLEPAQRSPQGVRLNSTPLRIGDLMTCGRTKFHDKRRKPGDCKFSAIVSNSEGVSQRPQRGSSRGLKAPVSSERSVRLPSGSAVNRREKLQVAVDVDEVLGFFVSTLNDFCAEEYRMQYHVSQYHIYDFKTVWGCSQEEANHRVHAFFGSKHFNQGIPPIPGAIQALLRLQAECHLVVVTSRQHVIQKPTLEWIDVHYPGIFKEVHFGNHYALEGVARPKSEICKSLGVEILIDDNPKYAMECAEHGIEVLLFDWNDSYPWSKTEDGPVHPLITRVRDWVEVEEVLLARTPALEP